MRLDTDEGRRYLPMICDGPRLPHTHAVYRPIGTPKRSHFDAASLIYRDVARRVDAGELRIERTENAS